MRSILIVLLQLLCAGVVSAQLTISAGVQFTLSGNVQLSLQNTNLVNHGNLVTGNSRVSFNGNNSSIISGNQPVVFYDLEMNKTNSAAVSLQRAIAVKNRIIFTSGLLNLGGFNTDLGTTGRLEGEKESSRVTGSSGGQLLFTATLNAPSGTNPGNLGAIISSSQNLGNVTIRRGHQSPQNPTGMDASVLRYYDIVPANNTNLNATLRFNYFTGELNGINENVLIFYKSDNGTNWSPQGFTTRNAAQNYAEKTGIASFSRWTLSGGANTPLPVRFTLFNLSCEGNSVKLIWRTAQEQNSSHFDIQKSIDGGPWSVIGTLPAAGYSGIERNYSFIDNSPVENSLYRIAQYDIDGRVQYTSILRSSCNTLTAFSVWPNPFHDVIFVNITSGNASEARINIYDSKGSLVKTMKSAVLQGNNQIRVEIGFLAKGTYTISVDWNNGQIKKAVQILKQ